MAQHFVKVVDDGTLAAPDGWMFASCDDTGEIFFIVERSTVVDEVKLNEAWVAARELVIEQAVREGRVRWVVPPQQAPTDSNAIRAAVLAGHCGGD